MNKETSIKELRSIPGVGKQVSLDLYGIGIYQISDLLGKDPQALYDKLCEKAGAKIDRCMLYTMRCAVYFASTPEDKRDERLLRWWNWKDN